MEQALPSPRDKMKKENDGTGKRERRKRKMNNFLICTGCAAADFLSMHLSSGVESFNRKMF